MGYRELLLVLLSSVLLTLLMVQINANAVDSQDALQQLEIAHTAASVGQQFIEEAKSKKFDAVSDIIDDADMPDDFTAWNSLGPGAWESYPNFNDVDDYNGYTGTVTVNSVPYSVSITVVYVRDSNLKNAYNQETYFKKMTVTVTSSYMENSVVLRQVYSYFGVD